MTQELLKLALEALETPWNAPYVDGCDLALGKKVKAITAIKEALAQPDYRAVKTYHEGKPVYVAQPQQEPVAFEKTVCPFCTSEWVTAEQHDRNVDRVEQKPVAWYIREKDVATTDSEWAKKNLDMCEPLYTTPPHPQQEQNLNCKSTQARLATAWGYTKVLDISDKRLMEMPPQRTEQEQQIETLKRCLFQMQEAAKNLVKQAKSLPPPQRPWVGLTDEEVMKIAFNFDVPSLVVRTAEAKLKELNT